MFRNARLRRHSLVCRKEVFHPAGVNLSISEVSARCSTLYAVVSSWYRPTALLQWINQQGCRRRTAPKTKYTKNPTFFIVCCLHKNHFIAQVMQGNRQKPKKTYQKHFRARINYMKNFSQSNQSELLDGETMFGNFFKPQRNFVRAKLLYCIFAAGVGLFWAIDRQRLEPPASPILFQSACADWFSHCRLKARGLFDVFPSTRPHGPHIPSQPLPTQVARIAQSRGKHLGFGKPGLPVVTAHSIKKGKDETND